MLTAVGAFVNAFAIEAVIPGGVPVDTQPEMQ